MCLANGGLNFMAPRSALQFAEHSADLMQVLYGKEAIATSAERAGEIYVKHSKILKIVAWGWNCALKNKLVKQGIPMELLPTDDEILEIRNLSHRTTAMKIANRLNDRYKVLALDSLEGVNEVLNLHHDIVLKAPWSGSGRGLRWVSNEMSQQDENWTKKVIREQRCVMVEHRHKVVQNFGLEYWVKDEVEFVGYSLFEVLNGVYRGNRLWKDEAIETYLTQYISLEELQATERKLSEELLQLLIGKYRGPLGVDMLIAEDEKGYYLVSVVEINFRHTMGHVAHALSYSENVDRDKLWLPVL